MATLEAKLTVKKAARSEQEVFSDLAAVCRRSGYVHAVAYFCFRDNVILYEEDLKKADMRKMLSPSRLIRTEINALLGLMIKTDIDWSLPAPKIVQEYMDATEQLLEELHYCMSSSELWSGLTQEAAKNDLNPFERGAALREPIFYGAEAADNLQYLDLAVQKYAADAP